MRGVRGGGQGRGVRSGQVRSGQARRESSTYLLPPQVFSVEATHQEVPSSRLRYSANESQVPPPLSLITTMPFPERSILSLSARLSPCRNSSASTAHSGSRAVVKVPGIPSSRQASWKSPTPAWCKPAGTAQQMTSSLHVSCPFLAVTVAWYSMDAMYTTAGILRGSGSAGMAAMGWRGGGCKIQDRLHERLHACACMNACMPVPA